jgi:Domain of unknown function (DUF5122) beta-propeller
VPFLGRDCSRRLAGLLVLSSLIVATGGDALAAPGGLDPSFGGDGKITTNPTVHDDWLNAVAVQPNGRIVVAGVAGSGGRSTFALARFREDGRHDRSFGGDGLVRTRFKNRGGSGAEAVATHSGDAGAHERHPRPYRRRAPGRQREHGAFDLRAPATAERRARGGTAGRSNCSGEVDASGSSARKLSDYLLNLVQTSGGSVEEVFHRLCDERLVVAPDPVNDRERSCMRALKRSFERCKLCRYV